MGLFWKGTIVGHPKNFSLRLHLRLHSVVLRLIQFNYFGTLWFRVNVLLIIRRRKTNIFLSDNNRFRSKTFLGPKNRI